MWQALSRYLSITARWTCKFLIGKWAQRGQAPSQRPHRRFRPRAHDSQLALVPATGQPLPQVTQGCQRASWKRWAPGGWVWGVGWRQEAGTGGWLLLEGEGEAVRGPEPPSQFLPPQTFRLPPTQAQGCHGNHRLGQAQAPPLPRQLALLLSPIPSIPGHARTDPAAPPLT